MTVVAEQKCIRIVDSVDFRLNVDERLVDDAGAVRSAPNRKRIDEMNFDGVDGAGKFVAGPRDGVAVAGTRAKCADRATRVRLSERAPRILIRRTRRLADERGRRRRRRRLIGRANSDDERRLRLRFGFAVDHRYDGRRFDGVHGGRDGGRRGRKCKTDD